MLSLEEKLPELDISFKIQVMNSVYSIFRINREGENFKGLSTKDADLNDACYFLYPNTNSTSPCYFLNGNGSLIKKVDYYPNNIEKLNLDFIIELGNYFQYLSNKDELEQSYKQLSNVL